MMKAEEFIQELRALIPRPEDLEEGVDPVKLQVIESDFNRSIEVSDQVSYEDPILELISTCKPKGPTIGIISFGRKIYEKGDLLKFALFTEDDICIDTSTSELIVTDLYDPTQVRYYCAGDSESFLQLVLIYAAYEVSSFLGKRFDQSKKESFLKRAMVVLKDQKYRSFAEVLFGINPVIYG